MRYSSYQQRLSADFRNGIVLESKVKFSIKRGSWTITQASEILPTAPRNTVLAISRSDITLAALCICSTSRNNAVRAHTVPICRASRQEQFDLGQMSISKNYFAARANCSMTHWCVIEFICKTSQFNEKTACLELFRMEKYETLTLTRGYIFTDSPLSRLTLLNGQDFRRMSQKQSVSGLQNQADESVTYSTRNPEKISLTHSITMFSQSSEWCSIYVRIPTHHMI